jgi:hypothetical protein
MYWKYIKLLHCVLSARNIAELKSREIKFKMYFYKHISINGYETEEMMNENTVDSENNTNFLHKYKQF